MSWHPPPLFRLRPAARAAALVVAAATLVIPPALAPAASAHDVFVGSTPAAGSTVATAPTCVTVSFEEPPLAAGLAMAVTAPDRIKATAGDPVLSGSTVTVPLVALTVSGDYTVAWRVVADDGHPVTGTFTFTLHLGTAAVPPAASPAVGAVAGTAAAGSSASMLPWVVVGVAALALVAFGVGLAMSRRSA